MATLKFPIGQHLGLLIWDKEEEKLSSEAIEDATRILYYMGYNASQTIDCDGICFGMRLIDRIDKNEYRNILFDFALVFSMYNINLPDLEYAKAFLKELFIPLEKKKITLKSELVVRNETFYLLQTDKYVVNGNGYSISNSKMYYDLFKERNELLPLIAKDKITDIILKIKTDCASGTFLNDPFRDSIDNFQKLKLKQHFTIGSFIRSFLKSPRTLWRAFIKKLM